MSGLVCVCVNLCLCQCVFVCLCVRIVSYVCFLPTGQCVVRIDFFGCLRIFCVAIVGFCSFLLVDSCGLQSVGLLTI